MKPKIGDRFKLGPWTWEVEFVENHQFKSCSDDKTLWLTTKDADSLVWIKEPATISKEARDEIVEWTKCLPWGHSESIQRKLDSMVRDGE